MAVCFLRSNFHLSQIISKVKHVGKTGSQFCDFSKSEIKIDRKNMGIAEKHDFFGMYLSWWTSA